jgi:hypothetical protein
MKNYMKYTLILLCGVILGACLQFFLSFPLSRKVKLSSGCDGNESSPRIAGLSVNYMWQGRGTLPNTIEKGNGLAHYDDWRLVDGAIVRIIREDYANWGDAFEAMSRRLIGAKSVCQAGPIGDDESFILPQGNLARVLAVFEDDRHEKPVEIITATAFDQAPGSMLEIIQAPTIAHALAKERGYYREDF